MSQEEETLERQQAALSATETIAEEPQEEVSEPSGSRVLEVPVETPAEQPAEITPKPKPKARGKRGPDKKQRAKPKPKARAVRVQNIPTTVEDSSEESADEATLQEIRSLHLLRSIRAYDSQRIARKNQMYASWFGR